MPVDYQQLHNRIKEIGAGARERQKTLEERRDKARLLLTQYAGQLDALRARVDAAKAFDPNLRCALPLNEPLDSRHPAPAPVMDATLIAADGSQINPDRHAAIQYFVINVGAIAMQLGSGNLPEVFTDTQLHVLDEFDDTHFTDSQLALQRDVAERKKLLEVSKKYSGTIIALTEGQLELWGAVDIDNARDFEKNLHDYIDALKELEKHGVITSGYVDKPGANWIVRLIEIATLPENELRNQKIHHPLTGATDLWLFSQILGKHERSAIFGLQAKSAEKYTGSISIHFFYLNVGDEEKPRIARIDVPAWVVNNKQALNNLHYALVDQARIMGHEPFPYVLHRAHEIAVVSYRDKEEIDDMLAIAIRNSGGELGEMSGKQSAKNLPGRTRYKA